MSYLVLILIGMGIIAPLAWLAVEQLYLNTQRASLLAQAQLVAAALAAGGLPDRAPSAYSQTANVQPGIHTRVIDAQGGAVIDLFSSQPEPGSGLVLPQLAQNAAGQVTAAELLSRPEIVQACTGRAATAVRLAPAGGQQVLYAAAPVTASDGSVIQIVYLATPLPDTRLSALPQALRWQLGGVLLLALLLSGAAGLLLARRIARPLSRLAAAAHAVASGDLGQNVPEDRSISELALLGQAFNRMTASLRQSDQAKTAFISDVSHELRTPLTVIKGTIETLQDGALDDLEARGPFLASMGRETERLIRLVNDLLLLTRAGAETLNLRIDALDLGELARQRCAHLAPAAVRSRVTLRVAADENEDFQVMADADRMAQVVDNLLDNAVRYSPPGAEVRVDLGRDGVEVKCSVSDAGPGIAAKHLPFIFERFYRADPARGRGQGGSGLGLAIVRSLIQAHGGRVAVESVEGQGAVFSFWLPAAR